MKNLKQVASRAALKQFREEGIENIKAVTRVSISDDEKTARVLAVATDNSYHSTDVVLG